MARMTVTNANGEDFQVELPDFAMDSTAGDIVSILEKLYDAAPTKKSTSKTDNDQKARDDAALNNAKEGLKGNKESFKELSEAFNNFKKQQDSEPDAKAQEEYNRKVANTNKFLEKSADRLAGFGFGLVSVTSLIAVGLFNAVTNAGESLNELTKAGVGFGDAQGSTIDALSELSMVGIDATASLTAFSRAAAVMGVTDFARLSREFDTLNESGIKLGMSLEESAERFAEELDTRARLGILEGVQSMQIQKETQQTMKTQQKFSQALGVSTDTLRAFANSLTVDTNILSGSLLRFNNSTQSAMVAGVKEFGTIMAGLGGKGGEDIAAAMTEAAAGGALGFSGSLIAMTQVLPRLQATTVELSRAMQNGTLTQEQAQKVATDFAKDLSNLSQGEKERIFAMERAGVEGATQMANAVRNFTASAARMEDLKIDPSAVQTGTNALNNVISKVMGMFEALRYSFLEGVGSVGDLGEAFENAQKIIFESLGISFDKAGSGLKSFGKEIGEKLPKYIETAANMFASLIKTLPTIIDGFITVSKGVISFFSFMANNIYLFGGLAAAILATTLAVKAFGAIKMFGGFSGGLGGKGPGAGAGAQKQIMDGAGSSGKAAGGMKAFGGGFAMMMKGIVTGLKILGKAAMNPMVWAGLGLITVAVIALATALRIAAPAIEAMGKVILNVMQGVGAVIESVGKGIAAIVTAIGSVVLKVFEGIGAVMVSVGKAIQAVFKGIGSIIMGIGNSIASIFTAIGKAAMMAGKGVAFIFEGMASLGDSFTGFIKEIGSLSGTQLLGAAAGLTAVGAALVAMTAGSVISQIAKGFANLFSDDPIAQFIRLGKVAPNITEMAEVMDNMGDTVDKFTDAVARIDGNFVASQMNVIRDAFITFGEALDQISFTDILKLGALDFLGLTPSKEDADSTPAPQQQQAPVTGPAAGTSPIIKQASKLGDNFTANYSQRDMLAKAPELYKDFQSDRKAKEDELMAGGSSKQRAELVAEREALKKYAPQIQKAGVGEFKDSDGKNIEFDNKGNVVNNQQGPAGTDGTDGTTTQVADSQQLATADYGKDLLAAMTKQNSLLTQLVRQNTIIAENI
jgi:hypothetical protein